MPVNIVRVWSGQGRRVGARSCRILVPPQPVPPYILEYKTGAGTVAVDRLDPSGKGTTGVWQGKWSQGWSSIVPFQMSGAQYILEYKTGAGTVAIDQIKPGGSGTTEVWSGKWTQGWSSIVPFQMSGEPYILEYKTGDGTVAIDQMKPDGKGPT